MKDLDRILDFTADLGKQMLLSGANLERVNDTMYRVCHSYGLHDVSVYSLMTQIIISAKDSDGEHSTRHRVIPLCGIDLTRLRRYSDLSRKVCSEHPSPDTLQDLLGEAGDVEDPPTWQLMLAFVGALCSICVIFGGGVRETIATAIIIAIVYYVMRSLSTPNLNRVIIDFACMFVGAILCVILKAIGLVENYDIPAIACVMLMIPGIQMVNAFRNLLCGNENNGILELFKVILEVIALGAGMLAGLTLFGGGIL